MRNFSNTAVETETTLLLTISGTSVTVVSNIGHPAAPFTLILAPDGQAEEVTLVTAKAGLVYTVVRGWGGTTAVEHPAGTVVRHGAVAEDFRERSSTCSGHRSTAPPTRPPRRRTRR